MSDFNENLWKMKPKQVTAFMQGRGSGSGDFQHALAMLQAKTLMAQETTARWTKWLVIATFVLIVVTAVATVGVAATQ